MQFLTTGEVAEACQVSIPTVKRWIREGHLTAFRTVGGHYRITEDVFKRFQQTHGMPTVADLPRILIIEDDAVFRQELVAILSWDKKYEVESAQDGYEGLIKVGTFKPDLLILDLHMPGLDGLHVCKRVKEDPVTCAIKIVVVTAYPEDNVDDLVFKAGADSLLEKPIQLAQLQAEVAHLLGVLHE